MMRLKRILLLIILLILIFTAVFPAHAFCQTGTETKGLIISEVVSSNSNSLIDPVLGRPDWIELYNASPDTISLKDYSIGKSRSKYIYYFKDDAVIGAGEYMLLYCCHIPYGAKTDKICTEFRLSKTGVLLVLSSPDGIMQVLQVPELKEDVSYAADSQGKYAYFETPTPGAANTGNSFSELGFKSAAPDIKPASVGSTVKQCCEKPVFSVPGGHQDGSSVTLKITTATKGASIRYTLDGSAPDAGSAEYKSPIKITKPSSAAGITVRAVAVSPGMQKSDQAAATYLFDVPHSLPVVCLSIKKSDLNYISASKKRSDSREREGYVEYYESNGRLGAAFPAGFRIAGAGTRLYKQRTFSLYLRRDYGQASVKYPFFDGYGITTFKSLQLRHMGAWQDPTLLRDAYLSDIVSGMNINNAHTKFAAVYINGKYWGLYELKENENEKFLASKHDIDSDKVVTIRSNNHNVNTGKVDKDIQNLYSLAAKNINDPDNFYQYIKLTDSNYFMDYLIAETFFECSDTYNQKYVHTTDNALKWQPLFYDLDLSLTDIRTNDFTKVFFKKSYVRHAATKSGPAGITNMSLYYAFYRNDEWMKKFFKRYSYVLNNMFTEDKLLAAFDEMSGSIKSEMQRTIARWGFPSSMSKWNKDVGMLRGYIEKRRGIVIGQLKQLRDQLVKEGRLKSSDINMAKLFPNG